MRGALGTPEAPGSSWQLHGRSQRETIRAFIPGFSRPSPTSVDFERDIYPKELEQREDITTSYLVELRKTPNISLTARGACACGLLLWGAPSSQSPILASTALLTSFQTPRGKEESQEHALSLVRFPKHCKGPKLETGLAAHAVCVMAAPKSGPPAKASHVS